MIKILEKIEHSQKKITFEQLTKDLSNIKIHFAGYVGDDFTKSLCFSPLSLTYTVNFSFNLGIAEMEVSDLLEAINMYNNI